MHEHLSPSARRSLQAAAERAQEYGATQVEAAHLLLAISEEEESRGATTLRAWGVHATRLRAILSSRSAGTSSPLGGRAEPLPLSESLRHALGKLPARGQQHALGTDLLLHELLATASELHALLTEQGVDPAALAAALASTAEGDRGPLEAEFARLELSDEPERSDLCRILDAAANRAREGLRVLEDYARFSCDDRWLTAELKEIRHELRVAFADTPVEEFIEARDTRHDIGSTLSTPAELRREDLADVVMANFRRTQEALRSLEEYGKLLSPALAQRIEAARYRLYTAERVARLGADSRTRLAGVALYVLVSSAQCRGGLEWTVRETLAGGAQAIQLREKGLADAAMLELARQVARVTHDAGALFILNDRPDLARLAGADGVHVGQADLPVREARRIVGPRALVGVSTHSMEQARQAVIDGASYLGVGPVFPSRTKAFAEFPGIDLVRQVEAEIRLPAFPIGGIDLEQLDGLLVAGIRRVAVSSAVCSAEDPRAAAAALRARLG